MSDVLYIIEVVRRLDLASDSPMRRLHPGRAKASSSLFLHLPRLGARAWQADENGIYGPDVIADALFWVHYYVVLARIDSSFAGCGERGSQIMSAYGSGQLCSVSAPDYQVNAVGASIVNGSTVMFCRGDACLFAGDTAQ